MPQVPQIEVVTPALTTLGEGPIWDVNEARLYWIDVYGGTIFRSTADGQEIRMTMFPGHLTSLALRAGGGAVVTSGTRIHFVDLESGDNEVVFDAAAGPGLSFNDGKVDRQGRFVTGIADGGLMEPSAAELVDAIDLPGRLYRLDNDRKGHQMADGIGVTNGPCFSPDGTTLYCGDSWPRRIYAFDYDAITGQATNRRTVCEFDRDTAPGANAVPDGATVDREGYIWVAVFSGGEVRRYAPDGTLDRRVSMPFTSPTSVAFGGPDLDVLFVTSMGDANYPGHVLPAGPLAGTILGVHGLGTQGVPETRFAG